MFGIIVDLVREVGIKNLLTKKMIIDDEDIIFV